MLRRNGSGKLSGTSGNSFSQREDVNPMATVANLVDAMLVLAVGIMLALILSWNLNVSANGQVREKVDKEDAVTDFDEDDLEQQERDDSQQLEEKGVVYYDPDTGKYYVIPED